MPELAVRGIRIRELLRRSTGTGHFPQTGRVIGRVDDGVVRRPRTAAEPHVDVADGHDGAAVGRYLLQLPAGAERYPFPVGRKEGAAGTFGTRDPLGLTFREASREQFVYGPPTIAEDNARTIRRKLGDTLAAAPYIGSFRRGYRKPYWHSTDITLGGPI